MPHARVATPVASPVKRSSPGRGTGPAGYRGGGGSGRGRGGGRPGLATVAGVAGVVVVGAGLGGLAAAARLTALGHDVTVLEQAATVGGKLGWFPRDGHGFDTGPSLLT